MMRLSYYAFSLASLFLISCDKPKEVQVEGTYRYDAEFLKANTKHVIELRDDSGHAKVLLSADYQGRVMTSTASGDEGSSYGWMNYSLIASGEKKAQFNPVGGEERFWLGPEGGQYSLYFHQGDSFLIKDWQVPAMMDTEPFDVVESNSTSATFSKKTSITNYSGYVFDLLIEREISLLNESELESALNTQIPEGINYVGYQTENQVKNVGATDWKKESGLISIWLLGMFTPSDQTTVIIPFKPSPNAKELITTSYFGEIPAERLQLHDSVLFFTCDGKYRSKIGLSPSIAKPISASYDFKKNILTMTSFEIVTEASYVNSKWEMQSEPYRGDAVNSYNDGPLADGPQLGPFYELESSSPALTLRAGESTSYKQITCHLEGDFEKLNVLVKHVLGVDLNTIKK
ncbi:MAG: hypothetical protein RI909_30 [Bacteroidota bacterium]|jgi:hypothetical protein